MAVGEALEASLFHYIKQCFIIHGSLTIVKYFDVILFTSHQRENTSPRNTFET